MFLNNCWQRKYSTMVLRCTWVGYTGTGTGTGTGAGTGTGTVHSRIFREPSYI